MSEDADARKKKKDGETVFKIPRRLGDFDTQARVLWIMGLAVVIGAAAALIAAALIHLIGLITNGIFLGRFDIALVSPGEGHAAWWIVLLAPIVGGLLVGFIARYAEAIRGHGIPEAIESILKDGSKIKPRVAILKPIASAITIGTGGPFGAEGPIIMSAGAFGSVVAQFLKLSADERKTLLVAGAAAGMAATFNAPLASILLAAELLLFEMRPRSLLPAATAVLVATIYRHHLLGTAAVFAVTDQAHHFTLLEYALCAVCGLTGGFLAWVGTVSVYFFEDAFRRLPIHWMWWPALGGVVVGIGGLIEPHALGVGYDVIRTLLQGEATLSLIIGILIVKTIIWSLALGSGTSGGVLAPVFMIGASLGALEAFIFPHVTPGFWALVSLSAVVGGVMRSPLTGIVFSMELTHEWSALIPLAIAACVAQAVSILTLKRSILTEKVVRKGLHLSREYIIDPLEVLFVHDVMERDIISFRATTPLTEAAASFLDLRKEIRQLQNEQRLYPVLDGEGRLLGVATRRDMLDAAMDPGDSAGKTVADVVTSDPTVAYEDMTLRETANLLAERNVSRLPVVRREAPDQVIGLITIMNVLKGRVIDLQEERHTERVLHLHKMLLPLNRVRTYFTGGPSSNGG